MCCTYYAAALEAENLRIWGKEEMGLFLFFFPVGLDTEFRNITQHAYVRAKLG